ncbi:MAG: hypothetical protein IKZ85_07675 [Pseudobutyrivibrio sp.]|nr:hypothetical protein [Pseudobutyrivibrio sp.]
MNESILNTIKEMLGYTSEAVIPFEKELIMHINTAFSRLTLLGLGPKTGFSISDSSAVWGDIIPNDMNLENVKTFIYLKVKIIFDPPTSTAALETMKEEIKLCEFDVQMEVDER